MQVPRSCWRSCAACWRKQARIPARPTEAIWRKSEASARASVSSDERARPKQFGEIGKACFGRSGEWVARQMTEAFPWDTAPRYLVRDRDAVYCLVVRRRLRALGIRDRSTAPRSPWQNAYVERLIGSAKARMPRWDREDSPIRVGSRLNALSATVIHAPGSGDSNQIVVVGTRTFSSVPCGVGPR